MAIIRTLYNGKQFRLADSIDKLSNDKYHGIIYNKQLCLRGNKLMAEILKITPKATLHAVIDCLKEQDALITGNDKNSIQISGTGGKRFYAIPLKKLR